VKRFVLLFSILLAVFASPTYAQETQCEAGFRLLENEFLATDPVCVPENPQRIAVADFAAIDLMYTLNIPAVGVSRLLVNGWYSNMVPELLPSINDYLGDAADLGFVPLNLEAVLAADPDLILVNSLLVADAAFLDQLRQIAPVVVKRETNVDDWREYMRLYGDALNRAEDTEALIRAYDARLEALRTDAGDTFAGKTATLIQANDPNTIYLNLPTYRGWLPLGEFGFAPYAPQQEIEAPAPDTPNILLSNELIQTINSDYIFIMNAAFVEDDSQAVRDLFASYTTDPLWSNLTAVQNGNLYLVDLAWQANGVVSAHAVIDDMYRLLLGMEPTTPNPYADRLDTDAPTATAEAPLTGTRSVEHTFGTTEIPVSPQRIIAADLGVFIPTFGVLAALDVKPIAVTANSIPEYLQPYTEGVEIIPGQVSYESLLAYNPDLIITPGVAYNEENFNSLALIAPTVAPSWYWQTLEQVTGYWRQVADLVNKSAEGEQLVADLNIRIEQLREELAPRMEGKTVSVFQVQGAGLASLFLQTGRLESALINAVGIERPANQTYDPNNPQWYVQLSPELLNEVDAWAIFVEVYADNPEDIPAIQAELEANPLWRSLDAVKNGRVFYVQTNQWSGTDPFVADYILDTLETNLIAALDVE
jgi:iron complex transport system substrate-binding protein